LKGDKIGDAGRIRVSLGGERNHLVLSTVASLHRRIAEATVRLYIGDGQVTLW